MSEFFITITSAYEVMLLLGSFSWYRWAYSITFWKKIMVLWLTFSVPCISKLL